MNKFDRFCNKYDRFGIRHLVLILVIGQAFVAMLMVMRAYTLVAYLTFDPVRFLSGEVWRIVTFIFIPEGGNLLWMALSIFFTFWVGRMLEAEWGCMKLTIFYLSGVLLSAAYSLITGAAATTFYLNLSLFFALATLYPDQQIRLYFLIPVKLKYVALVEAVIFVALPLFNLPLQLGNLFPLVAIANYLIFFWRPLLNILRHTRVGPSRRTVDFKSEVRRGKQSRGYVHKCAVCGCTDTERPDMEFRYCSLCAGYACYCADHIFNHTHKTMQ